MHYYTDTDHVHSGRGVHPSLSCHLPLLLFFSLEPCTFFPLRFFGQQVHFFPAIKCCALFLLLVFSCCISASLTFSPHACSLIYFAYFHRGASRLILMGLAR